MNNKPLILITNDDGVDAKGIKELTECLREVGDLVVLAPDGPRSGMSSAITSSVPLTYTLVKEEKGLTVYKSNGTPVDCVKLALNEVLDRKPDLLVSGINHGYLGVERHFKGSVKWIPQKDALPAQDRYCRIRGLARAQAVYEALHYFMRLMYRAQERLKDIPVCSRNPAVCKARAPFIVRAQISCAKRKYMQSEPTGRKSEFFKFEMR